LYDFEKLILKSERDRKDKISPSEFNAIISMQIITRFNASLGIEIDSEINSISIKSIKTTYTSTCDYYPINALIKNRFAIIKGSYQLSIKIAES